MACLRFGKRKNLIDYGAKPAGFDEGPDVFLQRVANPAFLFDGTSAKGGGHEGKAFEQHRHEIDLRRCALLKRDIDEASHGCKRAQIPAYVITPDHVED